MKSVAKNIQMTTYEDLLSGSKPPGAGGDGNVQEIPLTELFPFKDHPFKVLDDETMQDTVESVKAHGVLVPGIARPRAEGGYELIAGHRRKRASELAGKTTMPVIVRKLDDDEATLFMVDSNIQRENLLPSENRSQEHAVALVYKNIQLSHYYYVVDIDIKGFFDNVNHGKLLKQMWAMGIRDKKLLSIISAMLKAEVAGIGFPEKGTPQGGIISPLLSNIVLNELDWWIASQWEDFPTRKKYATGTNYNGTENKGNKYKMLRDYTRLKEVTCVRYADDFKLFAKSYQQAQKLFYAVEGWLKGRLGLSISPEKSKIVNLKETYSEFLGLRIKATNHGSEHSPKYVVESHIREKSLDKIKSDMKRLIHDIEFPGHGKRAEHAAVARFNSYVIGVHNYYSMATFICHDFHTLAFSVHKSLNARLKKRLKTVKQVRKRKLGYVIPDYIKERYGDSEQLKFVRGYALAPIGYVKHRNPMMKRCITNSYTPEGREAVHKMLGKSIDTGIMHYLMRNPIPYRTAAYNDNRISLYCAQYGKCAVTGRKLERNEIHCHHKLPKYLGGTDEYKNLAIVSEDVHRLIHATNPETIRKYLEKLNLDAKQLKKLEKFRSLAKVESCLKCNAI